MKKFDLTNYELSNREKAEIYTDFLINCLRNVDMNGVEQCRGLTVPYSSNEESSRMYHDLMLQLPSAMSFDDDDLDDLIGLFEVMIGSQNEEEVEEGSEPSVIN